MQVYLQYSFCVCKFEPFDVKWSKMRRLVVGSTTQIPEIMKEDEVNKSTSLLSGSPIQSVKLKSTLSQNIKNTLCNDITFSEEV